MLLCLYKEYIRKKEIGYMSTRSIKQVITSSIITIILLKVLFSSSNMISKIVVIPFLVFAAALATKNILIMLDKKTLAARVSKVYVIAFLVYWFGFLVYWDYSSWIDGNYMSIVFSIPCWIAGIYMLYKRLLKKWRDND